MNADLEARLARIEAALHLAPPVRRERLPLTPAGFEGRRWVGPVVQGCGCPPSGACVRADCPHQAAPQPGR